MRGSQYTFALPVITTLQKIDLWGEQRVLVKGQAGQEHWRARGKEN